MCVNEKRTLTIPSDLAYGTCLPSDTASIRMNTTPGSRGFGNLIPANSALVFDVELVGLDSKKHQEL